MKKGVRNQESGGSRGKAAVTAKIYAWPPKRLLMVDTMDGFPNAPFSTFSYLRGSSPDPERFNAPSFPEREIFAEAQADLDRWARNKGLVIEEEHRVCRVCGCRDDRACRDATTEEPCYWVAADLCSACVGKESTKENKNAEHQA